MAEPAELFRFDVPAQDAPVLSQEIRNNLTALGRTLYTADDTKPDVSVARDGMMRINAADPTNIKLDVFLTGSWRTILQGLAGGIAGTTKIIASFTSSAVRTIDHNLGSKPLVQVADSNNMQLESISPLPEPVTIASLSAADLTGVPPGPPFPVRSGILLPFNGSIVASQGVVVAPPAGPPTFSIDFAISGVPITGGTIVVPAAAPPGIIGSMPWPGRVRPRVPRVRWPVAPPYIPWFAAPAAVSRRRRPWHSAPRRSATARRCAFRPRGRTRPRRCWLP